ncbi:class I SAM-dependent methyltransferase [Natronomonas halophila]|uniref:class I SAM-dependent methyltransferase n=1 Tax=Natronomonas halophila TaxID=2747817 RepID=UPI0015B3F1B8|nr:class I SAM-dependent methyltransferase [Natronomonas halophila]QLD87078.1 class I SAM-dependent methyltransferase [Natronomonas halophila]
MDISGSRDYYEGFFSEDSPGGEVQYYANRQRYRIVFQLIDDLNLGDDAKVLEIGSGSGRIAAWLDDRFDCVSAVDIGTFEMMEKTIEDTDVRFLNAALPHLPFENEFDLVVCSEVLEHLSTRKIQRQAIAELAAVTTEGGYVVVSTPNPKALLERIVNIASYIKEKTGGKETVQNTGRQLVENWIPPSTLQSFLSEEFKILNRQGSYYMIPDLGTGLERYLRPISDYLTTNNVAPRLALYQYYVLSK